MTGPEREGRRDAEWRERAGALPREIAPPADIWPGIAHAIRRKPGRGPRAGFLVALGAAAAVAAVALMRPDLLTPGGWTLTALAGRPAVDGRGLARGVLRVGDALATDARSRARLAVGDIGTVEIGPGSRMRLLAATDSAQRMALERGTISAAIAAPPRIFLVDTPSGTAVDLGCAYTLAVDSAGNATLHVTKGWVELDAGGARSVVPLGASAAMRKGFAPGIPYVADAAPALVRALDDFDFGGGGEPAARRVLRLARAADALSVFHLMLRVSGALRAEAYDRVAAAVPPPAGVTRAAVLAGEPRAVEAYWSLVRRTAWWRELRLEKARGAR